MPGVPTSRRCQRCKSRKVKCDEKWPTCGRCQQAGKVCSGPQNLIQFINVGTSDSGENLKGSSNSPCDTSRIVRHGDMVLLKSGPVPGNGGSFEAFRLSSTPSPTLSSPRPNPTTSADRVGSRLAGYLDQFAHRDLLFRMDYLKLLPSRLNHCPELRDSVALLCSAYGNFKRGLPAAQWLNFDMYGKALRSLQRALDNRLCISSETVTATALMERIEVAFDVKRQAHRARHVAGIESLMRQKGPPEHTDQLYTQMTIEHHASLINQWATDGGENFLILTSWQAALSQAVQSRIDDSLSRQASYSIGRYYVYWPSLLEDFHQLLEIGDTFSRDRLALALRNRVSTLDTEVRCKGEMLMNEAQERGSILERREPTSPIGKKYSLDSLDTFQFIVSYVTLGLILNGMLYHLDTIQGCRTLCLDNIHQRFCQQIWMCIPYLTELGGTNGMLFAGPLYLSYQGAITDAEKRYVMDFITKMGKQRGLLGHDQGSIEHFVLNTAKAAAGYVPFDKDRAIEKS